MNIDSNEKLTLKNRILFIGIVAILVWLHLLWDYLHDGVPSHHILHRADLPSISNWWGGIAVPLVSWFLLYQIAKRINNKTSGTDKLNKTVYAFLGALLFGIILSFFFIIDSNIQLYMMIGAILISFFIPLYRAEFLLGFIIGMTYTFGGIIPIVSGIILTIIFTIAYKFVRGGMLYLLSKIRLKKG